MAKPTKHQQKDVDDRDESKSVAARRAPGQDPHELHGKHGASDGGADGKKRGGEKRPAGSAPPGPLARNAERDIAPTKHTGGAAPHKPHAIDEATQAAEDEERKLGRLSNEDSNELDQSADDQAADQAEHADEEK